MLKRVTTFAADCETNAGFGEISWPGALVLSVFIVAGAWLLVEFLRN